MMVPSGESVPLHRAFIESLLFEAERQERAGVSLLYITPLVQRRLCETALSCGEAP